MSAIAPHPLPSPTLAAPAPTSPAARNLRPGIWLATLVGLFFIASLASLSSLTRYRGDERFYTDAAIGMLESGDWITPHYADGQPRFRKPILPYWIVAVPFRTLGVGVATSRLGALAAATAMLWLTYRLARRLTDDARAATLAVAALASSVQVLNVATRATTDALQAACATLALVGLAGIAFAPRDAGRGPRRSHQLAFWIGVGLVAASKGGLALLLLAFAIVFLAWRGPRLGARLRDLIHWPAIALCVALSLGWIAAVLARHGHAAWADFWADQVGNRLGGGGGAVGIVTNFVRYATSIPFELMPWAFLLALAAIGQSTTTRAFFAERREQAWFAGLWLIVLTVTFTTANIQRTRYLLPAYPPVVAIGGALILRLWTDAPARRRHATAIHVILILVAVAAATIATAGLRIDPLFAAGLGVTAALASVAFLISRRATTPGVDRAFRQAIVFGLFLIAVSRVNDLLTRRPIFPASGPGIVRAIESAGVERIAAVGVPPGQLAQVRLLTAGRRRVDVAPLDATPDWFARYDAILYAPSRTSPATLPSDAISTPAGLISSGWRADDIALVCLGRRTAESVLARTTQPLVLTYASDFATRRHDDAPAATASSTPRDPVGEEDE